MCEYRNTRLYSIVYKLCKVADGGGGGSAGGRGESIQKSSRQ